LANMSHEIRTPMNAILGFTDLLSESEIDSRQSDFINTISTSSEALLVIINNILDFSKIESGHLDLDRVDFSLMYELDMVGEMFRHKISETGIELAIDIDVGVPSALIGDPLRLRQILTNLIGNAFKFTTEGEVAIRVTNQGGEAHRRVLLFRSGTAVSVSILRRPRRSSKPSPRPTPRPRDSLVVQDWD
jgi:two-component system sensor histidine kinase/response regulator